jgi:hypothetical protein
MILSVNIIGIDGNKLTQKLHLTVANARVKWMFGNQARSVVVQNEAGAYVAPSYRAPDTWYIACMSVYYNNSVPPKLIIDYRPEIPVLEVPNNDEWWDTNNGRAVNKKDLKFAESRGVTARSVSHLGFHDKGKWVEDRTYNGRLWDIVQLRENFTIGPTQNAVVRTGDLVIFGWDPSSLTQF